MSDPFIAEVRMFGFGFAPKGWAMCAGQLLPIAQNTAVFSLLGTNFGGDGRVNFALPNLIQRTPMHWGDGSGLSPRVIGQVGGVPTVTLDSSELPLHSHLVNAAPQQGDQQAPSTSRVLSRSQPFVYKQPPPSNEQAMAPQMIGFTGATAPHNNMMPYQALMICIALEGAWPIRP